jgi:rhodanese-related sulfurtransferase
MNKLNWMVALTTLFPLVVFAINEADVPKKRHTPFGLYLTSEEAYELKKNAADEVLFIDTRTRPEVKYIGMAKLVDAHIPSRFIDTDFSWSDKADTYRTTRNKHFISDINKLLSAKGKDKNTPILVMCQSGSRSTPAVKLMHTAGFSKVYNIYQGFEGSKAKEGPNKGKRTLDGWKNAGMPWSYKLDKKAMYFNFDSTSISDVD